MKNEIYYDKKTGDIKSKGNVKIPLTLRLGMFMGGMFMVLVYLALFLGVTAVVVALSRFIFG